MPPWVWPDSTDAVTRAWDSCWAYASPAAERWTSCAASAMSMSV